MSSREAMQHMSLTGEFAGKQPVQLAAAAVGVVFLLVGVLGFVPVVTTNADDLEFIGHESEARLLGLFAVNTLHNIVHLAFGVAGLVAARASSWSRAFLVYGGVTYLVLWVYGLVIDLDSTANFVNLNTADNWLHFGLGVGMIAVGLAIVRLRR